MAKISPVHQVLGTAELLDIVLVFLRTQIKEDAEAELCTGDSSRRVKWKRQFRNATFVNRAFFHASLGILWERMHSLDPFLSLLEPPTMYADTLVASSGASRSSWGRFELYSSRTKSLTSKKPRTLDSVSQLWGNDTEKRNSRPRTIFPALASLHVRSTDRVSLSIALSVCQRLKRLEVDLDYPFSSLESMEAIVQLSAALAESPNRFSLLRIRHAAGTQYLRNLSRLKPAGQLLVTLSCDDIPAIGPSYWVHRQVAFEEHLDGGYAADYYEKACVFNIHELSRLDSHRFIIVHGRSTLQTKLADNYATFSPPETLFNQIALELPYNGQRREDLLNPGTIGTYLRRNPKLTVLTVNCMAHAFRSQQPEAAERARNNPAFADIHAFLDPLSTAQNLTFLSICGIVFKPRDIVIQMLDTLHQIPSMTAFTFFPAQMSTRDGDILLLPSFASLADIQECNPRLRIFGTYMSLSIDTKALPTFSSTFSSDHPLEKVTLFPGLQIEPDVFPVYTTRENLKIAMFVDRLFPNLKPEGKSTQGHSNAVSVFWNAIYDTISSFQEVRELARRESLYSL